MPKIFGKELPTSVVGGLALVTVVLVYTQLVPAGADAPRGVSKKGLGKKSSNVSSLYTKEDYTVKLASYMEPVRNSFQPLVVRKSSVAGADPSSAPLTFTGGEANWVYTGMATVNGVNEALLENRKTGDAAFVKKGEQWKTSTIYAISADSVTLSGPGGSTFTMAVSTPSEPTAGPDVNALAGVAPVTVPGMVGQIGSNDLSIQPTNTGNNGGGRRRQRMNQFTNPTNLGNTPNPQ